ncbi:MAG: histidine kinase [Thermoflexibacter sp.]|jgi:sensor histidine kinase YesM|nr:histidine kinase [Thermoflexibacter sp.]
MKLQKYSDFVYDLNNRLYTHILFWFAYYVFRVLIYGDVVNTYKNVIYVQFLELPVKIIVVYINLYILIPKFLKEKKTVFYLIAFNLIVIIGGLLQQRVILFCMSLGIYDFNYKLFTARKFLIICSHIYSILAITTVIKVLKDAYYNLQINQALIQAKLENELKFLKAQINPHFFFNTLNNLYALTLKKSDQAPEVVLKLSELMSYMIYEAKYDLVSLEKEVDYLKSYMSLEKLRFGDELKIDFQVDGILSGVNIPPLILLPFVENAFKHGVHQDIDKVWIRINLIIKDESLVFKVENSQLKRQQVSQIADKGGGIGLNNIRRRLELLYEQDFELKISDNEDIYSVELRLNMPNAVYFSKI